MENPFFFLGKVACSANRRFGSSVLCLLAESQVVEATKRRGSYHVFFCCLLWNKSLFWVNL